MKLQISLQINEYMKKWAPKFLIKIKKNVKSTTKLCVCDFCHTNCIISQK